MDLGESRVERGLGGWGGRSQGNMTNGEGLLRRGAVARWLCVPAVKVCLVQTLPGTLHLVDAEVKRRTESAAHRNFKKRE